jgi:hypothetical protein
MTNPTNPAPVLPPLPYITIELLQQHLGPETASLMCKTITRVGVDTEEPHGDIVSLLHAYALAAIAGQGDAVWLTQDEILECMEALTPDHDGQDFESECPACTAYKKLSYKFEKKRMPSYER